MKLLATLTLTVCAFAACATGPRMVPLEGAVGRSVERVLERHDTYVGDDVSLDPLDASAYLAQSADARTLFLLPEASGAMLNRMLGPVLDRHDAYVLADESLDAEAMEAETYLATTRRLRSLIEVGTDPQ